MSASILFKSKRINKKNVSKTTQRKINKKKVIFKLQNNKLQEKLIALLANKSIDKKISSSFKLIIGLMGIAMICSMFSIISMASRTNKLYNSPYIILSTISDVKYDLKELDDNLFKAISTKEKVKKDYSLRIIAETSEKLKKDIEVLREKFTGDPALVDTLAKNIETMDPIVKEASNLLNDGKQDRASRILDGTYSTQATLSQNTIADISKVAETDARNFVNGSNIYRNLSVFAIFVVILIIIFLANLVGKTLKDSLLEGIINIKNISKNLLEGNLQINSTYKSQDEIGEMSNDLINALEMLTSYIQDITSTLERLSNSDLDVSLNNSIQYKGDFAPIQKSLDKIVTSLNITFYDMRQAINFSTSSSEQLSLTTQALSNGSTEQAQAVEDLLSSFNNILTQVQKNTNNAYKANEFSDKTKCIVTDGSKKMSDLMESMKEITNSSKQIAEIISTIEDIASQTNLLALNAAIEAARAGDAGRGFAVVADEVKRLAAQSSQAVKNTTQIINKSLAVVIDGETLANETADALTTIVKNVDDTADLVKQIANESKEQASAIEKMTDRVNKISSVVQTNSATAEETAASTQELASQSQLISDKLSIYKLKMS